MKPRTPKALKDDQLILVALFCSRATANVSLNDCSVIYETRQLAAVVELGSKEQYPDPL